MAGAKLTKQQVVSSLSLIIFIVIMAFLVKVFILPTTKEFSQPNLFIPPAYLTVPIPSLASLEKIFTNARFQELNYLEALFAPIKIEAKGRPNPFIPF